MEFFETLEKVIVYMSKKILVIKFKVKRQKGEKRKTRILLWIMFKMSNSIFT